MAETRGRAGRPGATKLPPGLAGRFDGAKPLGRGRLGTLIGARQPELDRPVALRLLDGDALSDPVMRARVNRAAAAWARVEHPNVVALIDADTAASPPWLALQFVDGLPLRERWSEESPPTVREVLILMADVASALAAAAAGGLVHGGLTPECIMVMADGSVRVTDFGAPPAEGAPPDAAGAEPGPAADVHALGSMVCEVLTGVAPATGSDPSSSLLEAVPDLPPECVALLRSSVAASPRSRPSAADLATALRAAGEIFPDEAPARRRRSSSSRSAGRRPVSLSASARVVVRPAAPPPSPWRGRVAAIVVVLLLLLAGVGFLSSGSAPSEAAGSITVLQSGSTAALVAWSLATPSSRATVRVVEESSGDAREQDVESMLPRGEEPDPAVGHVGVVTGLEPLKRYQVSLKTADGAWSLGKPLQTEAAVTFDPRVALTLEPDGVHVAVDAAVPAALRVSPSPDDHTPTPKPGLPTFERRHALRWSYASAAKDPAVTVVVRTLAGDERRVELNLRGAVREALEKSAAAIDKARADGWFAACFTGPEMPQGKFLREGKARITAAGADATARTSAAALVWEDAVTMLRRTAWFPPVEPLLPGMVALQASPLADDAILDAAARVRASLLLIQRTAEWNGVTPNPSWAAWLAPAGRPRPMSVNTPFLTGPSVKRVEGSILSLAGRDVYLMFDSSHPSYRGVFTSTLAKEVTAGREFTVDLSGLDLKNVRQAEVEVVMRTAVLPVSLAVTVNRKFTAMLEDSPEDAAKHEAWRRESGANVREVSMMMSGDFGAKDKMRETIETLEAGLPPEPRRVYHRVPLSALTSGSNRIALDPWAGPVDSLEYVAVTEVALRVGP